VTATTIPSTFKNINRLSLVLLLITYIAFINLGMSDTMRDVAFPYIRDTFSKPLEASGFVLLAATIGYMIASFSGGQVVTWLGIGKMLALSVTLRAMGLAGFALAPTWEMLLLISVVIGLGGGLLDSGANIYVAANYGATPMFWLHAAFGIGATIGPLMMTLLIERLDQTWHMGYFVASSLHVGLLVIFIMTLKYWSTSTTAAQNTDAPIVPQAPVLKTLSLPAVWLSILIFILYTGTEVAAPMWGFSLFTEVRGIDAETAGYWITIYWATFTIGRIAAGFITTRMPEKLYIRLSLAGAVIGAALLWWSPSPTVGLIGLAGLAFALAPLFPAMISSTEERVSPEHTANAIGFQIAAAGLGVAIVPGIAGVLAQRLSLEIVPVVLVVVCVMMLFMYELLLRGQRR
jgi:fucose permease